MYTTKEYFRGVTAIEAAWLPELIPEWFSSKSNLDVCLINSVHSLLENESDWKDRCSIHFVLT